MNDWVIILIITLVAINFIVFFGVLKIQYDDWKKGSKWDWTESIIGFFFIIVCAFMLIALPIRFIIQCGKKWNKKKLVKESEAYHFCSSQLRLKDLPFEPSSGDLIFIENGYNARINEMIQRNLDYIQECCDKAEFYKHHFVYLPNLFNELSVANTSFDYYAPYEKEHILSTRHNLSSDTLLGYMFASEKRRNIRPCFARYIDDYEGCSWFECISFDPEEGIDEKKLFRALCSCFDYFPAGNGLRYQTLKEEADDAEGNYEKTIQEIMREIEVRVEQLRKRGISQWAIKQLVEPKQQLSQLVITCDYRIFLPDYNNMEIKMEPLVKAVYLLFLRHPEGLIFKDLPDYREELTEIYLRMKPNGLSERARKSIEDVTNPMQNSINEKCARIRGAFLEQFDNHLAKHYYIDGLRAEPKKIALPRELVVWEE